MGQWSVDLIKSPKRVKIGARKIGNGALRPEAFVYWAIKAY